MWATRGSLLPQGIYWLKASPDSCRGFREIGGVRNSWTSIERREDLHGSGPFGGVTVVAMGGSLQRMFGSLKGKRIVVTGSSTGIGAAIARECAAAGANIVVSYRTSRNDAERVADSIRDLGRSANIFAVDLTDAGSCDTFVKDCWKSGAVDGVVNNAGADLLTGDMGNAEYFVKLQALLDVDVCGTVRLAKVFGEQLKEQGSGCVLTVGWDQSDRGMEGDSGELFSTAKNAIMGFSRSLAMSLAPHVRVNCIAPGWIQTEWGDGASDYWQRRVKEETPLKRWGRPQDIANVTRFLLSDEAAYITGQVINVNGGSVR